MEYKISELVALTNVPKSTIHYYIKEGLLPKAKKIKSNVHRYNDEHVELIRYIKYMQQEIGSSNQQIKIALQNKNQLFSNTSSMLTPLIQTLSDISSNTKQYSKKDFIETFDIDENLLEELLHDGILVPINNSFTDKELSIVRLIEDYKELGLEYRIIKRYVYHAKEMSKLEQMVQVKLSGIRKDENFSTLWKIMFGTLLSAKKYIFDRYTYKVLFNSLKEEINKT